MRPADDGFSNRNVLVRWTHRIEAAGLELCNWAAACTAEQLHAPRIAAPKERRRPLLREMVKGADVNNPLELVLPRLTHSRPVPTTTLDLESLAFKRLLLARTASGADVAHTSVVIPGSPTGQTLQETEDSLGDADECFRRVTTGARNHDEEQEADERELRTVRALARLEAQRARIRAEAVAELEAATGDATTAAAEAGVAPEGAEAAMREALDSLAFEAAEAAFEAIEAADEAEAAAAWLAADAEFSC